MAIEVVHKKQTGSVAAATLKELTAATKGNLLVAFINQNASTAAPTGKDNVSGTTGWTADTTAGHHAVYTASANSIYIVTKTAVGGETELNPTAGAGGTIKGITYFEISGASTVIDAILLVNNGASASFVTSELLETKDPGDIILGVVGMASGNSEEIKPWTGFGPLVNVETASSFNVGGSLIPGEVVPLKSVTANWTKARVQGMIVVAFKPEAAKKEELKAKLEFSGTRKLMQVTKQFITPALSFLGTPARNITAALSAGLSFIGALPRNIVHGLSAGTSLTGSIPLKTEHLLAASTSFAVTLPQRATHVLSGGLSFAGILSRKAGHTLSAGLSLAGTLPRNVLHGLSATLGPAVSLVPSLFTGKFTRKLEAGLSFFVGNTGPNSVGTLADSLVRDPENPLSNGGKWSVITEYANVGEITAGIPLLAGWTGSSVESGARWNEEQSEPVVSIEIRNLAAGTGVGVWACLSATEKSGYLGKVNSTGAITIEKWVNNVQTILATGFLVSGLKGKLVLIVSGGELHLWIYSTAEGLNRWTELAKTTDSTYTTGYVGFTGKSANTHLKNFTFGPASAVSIVTFPQGKIIRHALSAAASFLGQLKLIAVRPIQAALTFAGSMIQSIRKAFQPVLTPTALLSRASRHPLSGALSFVVSLPRVSAPILRASLTFIGSLPRSITRRTLAGLEFLSEMAPVIGGKFVRKLTATITFQGSTARSILFKLGAVLSFVGNVGIARQIRHALGAGLSFAGILRRGVRKGFTATLSFASLPFVRTLVQALKAVLAFAGSFKPVPPPPPPRPPRLEAELIRFMYGPDRLRLMRVHPTVTGLSIEGATESDLPSTELVLEEVGNGLALGPPTPRPAPEPEPEPEPTPEPPAKSIRPPAEFFEEPVEEAWGLSTRMKPVPPLHGAFKAALTLAVAMQPNGPKATKGSVGFQVSLTPEKVVELGAGGYLGGWGVNTAYEAGAGYANKSNHSAVAGNMLPNNIITVQACRYSSFVLLSDGTVRTWGVHSQGTLGVPGTVTQPFPVQPAVTNVVGGSASGDHSVVVKSDGTVRTWGSNAYGQLGINVPGPPSGLKAGEASYEPVEPIGVENAIAVSTAGITDLALLSNGRVMAWGANMNGQIGDGTTIERPSPVLIPGLENVIAIASFGISNAATSLALLSNGTVMAWGWGIKGQMGNGEELNSHVPQLIPGFTKVIAIDGGQGQCFAIKDDGTAWGWGSNNGGGLGLGPVALNVNRPTQLPLSNVSFITGGLERGHAISQGKVYGWGLNNYGQLGDGTEEVKTSPVLLPLSGVESITDASLFSLVILQAPLTPTFTITKGVKSILLNWEGEPAEASWKIAWKLASAEKFGPITVLPTATRTFTITGLTSGEKYELYLQGPSQNGRKTTVATPL